MARKAGLTIGKTRSALYKTSRILGDINAVKRGTIGQRLTSRGLGMIFGRIIGGIVRGIFGRR